MSAERTSCSLCDVSAGTVTPVGGVLFEDSDLRVHAVLGPTPVAGWCVVVPKSHVEQLDALPEATAISIMKRVQRLAAAQAKALGAVKSYVALFAEVVPHLHFHVIPRLAETPDRYRGPKVFSASPEDMVSIETVEQAMEALKAELRKSGAGGLSAPFTPAGS